MAQARMSALSIGLAVAGSLGGALAIALLLTGWIEVVPYSLTAAGAFYIAAAIIGLTGSPRRR